MGVGPSRRPREATMACLGRRFGLVAASLLFYSDTGHAEYKEAVVANGGSVRGTVRVAGSVVPLPSQPVYKEKDFCGDAVTDERFIVDAAGNLANVAVHLEGIQAGKPVPRAEPVRFDNRK